MTISVDILFTVCKVLLSVSLFYVWVVRYENIKKEFKTYKLPKMFRDLIGILKISFTVMLQFENNNLVFIGSLGIVALMLGAVGTHLKMKNPTRDMLPAITMLSIGLIILLHTIGLVP